MMIASSFCWPKFVPEKTSRSLGMFEALSTISLTKELKVHEVCIELQLQKSEEALH